MSKIEEDAKLFISQEGTSSVPSLHKFLPLLKQAILTFEQINPTPSEKVSLHDRYQNLKPHAGSFPIPILYNILQQIQTKDHEIISRQENLPKENKEIRNLSPYFIATYTS